MELETLRDQPSRKMLAPLGWTLQTSSFMVGDPETQVCLWLRRLERTAGARGGVPYDPKRGAVLLLHGGNSSGDAYLFPRGGLARYLAENGWDVWLLEWRSSPHVVSSVLAGPPLGGTIESERAVYNVDYGAEVDLPAGLEVIRKSIGPKTPLSIVGHCFGGGALAMAVARGKLEASGAKHLVFSTMALFYEVPWNGWIKAEDYLIERVLSEPPGYRAIDPKDRGSWPKTMSKTYGLWPAAWLPRGLSSSDEMLKSLTYMFGQPYSTAALAERVSGDVCEYCFGPMHIGLFQHASQLVRRGYAARFNAPDVIDRSGRFSGDGGVEVRDDDLKAAHFLDKRVRLITAADNHLWHRDSMDLMYEWLCRIGTNPRERYSKHVFAGYNIQELLWGIRAEEQVFPAIAEGLAGGKPVLAAAVPPSTPPPPLPGRRPSDAGTVIQVG